MNVFLHQQEMRNVSQRRKRLLKRLQQVQQVSLVVFAGLMVGAVLYGAYVMVFEKSVFAIRTIKIDGDVRHIGADVIKELAKVEHGSSLFRTNVFTVRERIARHPWVAEVAVRRKLPHTLWIYVTERQPLALVAGKNLQYVDETGALFPAGNNRLEDLPVLTGFPADQSAEFKQAFALIQEFLASPLGDMLGLSEVHYDNAQGYSILTGTQGIQIRLGWDQFADKLNRVVAMWPAMHSENYTPLYLDTTVAGKIVAKYDM